MNAIAWHVLFCAILASASLAQERPTAASTTGSPARAGFGVARDGVEAPFHISGVLLDSTTGEPVRQAQVAIAAATASDAYATVVTDGEGHFAFPNLAPGKYNLRAQKRGYLAASFDEHDGYSTSIAVGPNLESDKLVFRLQPQCSISGRISDESGEPVNGAEIHVYQAGLDNGRQRTFLRQQVMSDEEGLYHVGYLSPGKYFLVVVATVWYAQRPEPQQQGSSSFSVMNYQSSGGSYPEDQGRSPLDVAYPVTFYPGVTQADAATPIALKAGDRFVADINLQPVPAVRIRVPAGQNVKREFGSQTLQLQSRMPDGAAIQAPQEMRFLSSGDVEMVGIPPGHYEVQISSGGPNRRTTFGETDVAGNGELNLKSETASGEVSATVQLDPGATMPVQGELALMNTQTGVYFGADVPSPGATEFQGLPPGTYEVSLNTNNGDFIKTVSAVGATVRGRTIEIKGSPVKLNITLAHGHGEITGVALHDDKPMAGVMIVLVPSTPTHNRSLFRRDQTDTDGTFSLTAVVPGKYTLLAIEHGWDLEWSNPSVLKSYLPAGEVVQVQANGKYQLKAKVQ